MGYISNNCHEHIWYDDRYFTCIYILYGKKKIIENETWEKLQNNNNNEDICEKNKKSQQNSIRI